MTSGGGGQVSVYGDGDKAVAGLRARGGTGIVAVTNSSGDVVSEMSVLNQRGQVVVWNPGGKVPAAIMAQAGDRAGGVIQVSNESVNVASLTVSSLGAGFLELTDSTGRPTVHAGTMPR